MGKHNPAVLREKLIIMIYTKKSALFKLRREGYKHIGEVRIFVKQWINKAVKFEWN